jgi:hypothetical protein
VKIRMLIPIAGTFHGHHGVNRGDVIEVDDVFGARYCKLHYCEPVVDRGVECAVLVPEGEVRSAPPAVELERDSEPDEPAQSGVPKPGARPVRK